MRNTRACLLVASLAALGPVKARAALYDDLGGDVAVHAIVDGAVKRWLADPRVGPTFAETNMERFRRLLFDQLCQVADGPCRYAGRSMAAAHRGLNLTQNQFNAVAEDLQDAMEDVGVAYHTQNRLIARLAPMERDTVTK